MALSSSFHQQCTSVWLVNHDQAQLNVQNSVQSKLGFQCVYALLIACTCHVIASRRSAETTPHFNSHLPTDDVWWILVGNEIDRSSSWMPLRTIPVPTLCSTLVVCACLLWCGACLMPRCSFPTGMMRMCRPTLRRSRSGTGQLRTMKQSRRSRRRLLGSP